MEITRKFYLLFLIKIIGIGKEPIQGQTGAP
jgi:hypothetical protein